jgi:hypothetical protein
MASNGPRSLVDIRHSSEELNVTLLFFPDWRSLNASQVIWGPDSKHFIIFVTDEWAHIARVFVLGKPLHPTRNVMLH